LEPELPDDALILTEVRKALVASVTNGVFGQCQEMGPIDPLAAPLPSIV
jgi:hypothetical protein